MRVFLAAAAFAVLVTSVHAQDVYHRGYVTNRGTWVAPHYQTRPDGNPYNNYSTRGNVNPYTGRVGTVHPYGGMGDTLDRYGYHTIVPR